ncbi:acyltransferase family protein [Sphingomonas adhaesiva]|uniref:acyltransferase family protein n=1 Tax=Sphingomonas adhaesiva TaxID=28212 RepID=UPI002FF9C363
MNKTTSVYLDAWRIIAACVVLLAHVNDWGGQAIPFFTPAVASQGVLIFFVLSGFVISYVVTRREGDWRSYAVARAARIYSVALPAIALTFLIDAVAPPLPHWIVDDTAVTAAPLQALAGLTFLNELWSHHIQLGSNSPYWSMGYEVPFYICFGLALFLQRGRKWLVLLAIAIYGPRIAIMGTIWLMGAATQLVCRRRLVGRGAGIVLFVASMAVIMTVNALVWFGMMSWTDSPIFWHRLRDLPADFLIATAFAAGIVGIDAACRGMTPPAGLARAIQWWAGCTFTLYLFHVPLSQALVGLSPALLRGSGGVVTLLVAIVLVTLAIAELTERRKVWWHALFARLLRPRSERAAA